MVEAEDILILGGGAVITAWALSRQNTIPDVDPRDEWVQNIKDVKGLLRANDNDELTEEEREKAIDRLTTELNNKTIRGLSEESKRNLQADLNTYNQFKDQMTKKEKVDILGTLKATYNAKKIKEDGGLIPDDVAEILTLLGFAGMIVALAACFVATLGTCSGAAAIGATVFFGGSLGATLVGLKESDIVFNDEVTSEKVQVSDEVAGEPTELEIPSSTVGSDTENTLSGSIRGIVNSSSLSQPDVMELANVLDNEIDLDPNTSVLIFSLDEVANAVNKSLSWIGSNPAKALTVAFLSVGITEDSVKIDTQYIKNVLEEAGVNATVQVDKMIDTGQAIKDEITP